MIEWKELALYREICHLIVYHDTMVAMFIVRNAINAGLKVQLFNLISLKK